MHAPTVIVLEGRPRRCQKIVTTLAQVMHNTCPVLICDHETSYDTHGIGTVSAALKPSQKSSGGRR